MTAYSEPLSEDFHGTSKHVRDYGELIALLVISSVSAFCFVYQGFMPGDSLRYAEGIQRLSQDGIEKITTCFNGFMSFGYYLLMMFMVDLFGHLVSLGDLMNRFNAVISVFLQGTVFILCLSLTKDKKVSFAAGIAVLLSPSIWMLSYYGHPGLLSVTLFILSLILFDKICTNERDHKPVGFLWVVFFMSTVGAMAVRSDIILSFGAFWGILYVRGRASVVRILKTIGILAAALALLSAVKWSLTGHSPLVSGTVSAHISTRLESVPVFTLRNTIINLGQWMLGANPVIGFLAIAGMIRFGPSSPMGVLFVSWILPWFVYLPFRGMDIPRIAASTIPIICLFSVVTFHSILKKRKFLGLMAMIVFAQIVSEAVYYPLVRIYPFILEIEGRTLANFPIGFPPLDHYYKQKSISSASAAAKRVVDEKDADVLIIARGSGVKYYEYFIQRYRQIRSIQTFLHDPLVFRRIVTRENEFLFLNLDHNRKIEDPIKRSMAYIDGKGFKIHIMPHWKEYRVDHRHLFLTKASVGDLLLQNETPINSNRRVIPHQWAWH